MPPKKKANPTNRAKATKSKATGKKEAENRAMTAEEEDRLLKIALKKLRGG